MNFNDSYFVEYLALAQAEALTERERRILALRYGLAGGDPLTLEQVGQEIGVSRERIRQILKRIHRKIRSAGRRQKKSDKIGGPCAQLIQYVESMIRPGETGEVDRLVDFVLNELSDLPINTHALPLVTFLIYSNSQKAKSCQKKAK